jgi:hypothetical protein
MEAKRYFVETLFCKVYTLINRKLIVFGVTVKTEYEDEMQFVPCYVEMCYLFCL